MTVTHRNDLPGKVKNGATADQIRRMYRFDGKALQRHRLNLGMRRDALAAEAELSESAIGLYETGLRVPRMDSLCALASVLDVSISDLFERQMVAA